MGEPKTKRRKISEDKEQNCILEDLEKAFEVKFNDDVSHIWQWLTSHHAPQPLSFLKKLIDLQLCGPFQYLFDKDKSNKRWSVLDLHMMDREWQCPPEFQPIARRNNTLYALWRDTPCSKPVFVVRKESDSGVITPVATDLYHLIRLLSDGTALPSTLEQLINRSAAAETIKQAETKRRKSVVAKTFNKIGIVVPVDKKTELGYRPLTMTYSELDSMLRRTCKTDDEEEKDRILAPFDECINYIQFANDECDYGMGFELGMCLFSHETSKSFMGTIRSLLPMAYKLLKRQLYAQIMTRICDEEDEKIAKNE